MPNNISNEHVSEVCRLYYRNLTKLAFSYLKNMFDAQDIVSDVFVAYISSAPDFESDEHERAWLIRVTINKCKNSLKKSSRLRRLDDIVHYSPPEQDDIEVLSAVLSLPEKYRLPVHLFYYEDMSIAQIAKALGEKPATIGSRLARARKLLKDYLLLEDDYEN